LGFGNLGLGGSSFLSFFFFGSLSPSPSALRFLVVLGPSGAALPALFLAIFALSSPAADGSPSSSAGLLTAFEPAAASSASLSFSAFSFSLACAALVSLASFFLRAFSFFFCSQSFTWDWATAFGVGFLQCLH